MSLGREFIALSPPMARAGEPGRGRPPRPVALAAHPQGAPELTDGAAAITIL
jgi:hypothetical protein